MSVKTGGKIDRYLKNNAAQARQEKKYRSARFSRWRGRALSWAYLAPSLIGVGLFFVLPFGVVIYYSLINNPVQHDFVGYSNFVRTWENNAFQLAARNTLIFSFAAVPLAVVLSLWLAVIMESRIPLKSTFRTFFLSPMMVPIASVILVWQVLFDYNGLVNAVISRIGIGKVDWLKSYYGPVVIILLFLWKNLGLFVIIMSLINSFKVFREVYLLAGNYPFDSLYTMQHYMNNTFQSLDYQKLSSAAIIMAAFMMVVIGILLLLEDWFGRDLEQ